MHAPLLLQLGIEVVSTAAVPDKGKVHRYASARHQGVDDIPLGFSIEHMDTTADPAQDFYRYAAGGFLDRAVIDETETEISGQSILAHRVNDQILTLLQDAAAKSAGAPKGSLEQQVGDYFAAAMDVDRLEALGISPLQSQLDRIEAIATPADIAATIGRLLRYASTAAFVGPAVGPDPKQNTVNVLMLYPGSLPLRQRDIYLSDDYAALRVAYETHVQRVLMLAGAPEATAALQAKEIIALETAMAQALLSRAEKADPEVTYNKMPVAEMKALAPRFDFDALFDAVGLKAEGDVVVSEPAYLKVLDGLLADRSLSIIKAYLRWRLINATASYLGGAFEEADLDFYSKTMQGTTEVLPREQRMAAELHAVLGHPVAQLYVKKYFTEETRVQVSEIVSRIKAQFEKRLHTNPWLDEATRAAALDKLAQLNIYVGKPDTWIDYSSLEVRRDDYLGNAMRLNAFNMQRTVEKTGQPVVNDEFAVPGATLPTDINAAYQKGANKIELTTAILQTPFFNPALDPAVNYGTTGAVIGHELTHGFDSSGRLFDATGNMRNWWTEGDTTEFVALASKLAAQYDEVEVLPGVHVNGKLTITEDVADLGGLMLAYEALQEVLAEQPGPETIDGLTPNQRFFIAWAQLWMTKIRPEALKMQVVADPHPPSQARAAGSSINMKAFYDTFNIQPGDAMWRDEADRVEIW